MQINSLTLVKTAMQCSKSSNPTIVNAFNTLTSWFIANDGFRSDTLTIPEPVQRALTALKDYTKDPSKYPDELGDDDGPDIA